MAARGHEPKTAPDPRPRFSAQSLDSKNIVYGDLAFT